MTTLEETIYLMDWIREHGELGLTCMTNDGEYEHLPEYCGRTGIRVGSPCCREGVAGEVRGSLDQGRNHYAKNH